MEYYAAMNKNKEISINWFPKDAKQKKKAKEYLWYDTLDYHKDSIRKYMYFLMYVCMYVHMYIYVHNMYKIYVSAHSGKKNEEAETNYQLGCLPTREDGKGWGGGGKGNGEKSWWGCALSLSLSFCIILRLKTMAIFLIPPKLTKINKKVS